MEEILDTEMMYKNCFFTWEKYDFLHVCMYGNESNIRLSAKKSKTLQYFVNDFQIFAQLAIISTYILFIKIYFHFPSIHLNVVSV